MGPLKPHWEAFGPPKMVTEFPDGHHNGYSSFDSTQFCLRFTKMYIKS